MSFESPDMEKDFPGLYSQHSLGSAAPYEEEERSSRKKDLGRRRESQTGRKGKGYMMFEEEDSEEEFILAPEDTTKSPAKMKKHSKPSFKFPKREKLYKPGKEKEKEKWEKEKEKSDRVEKEGKKKEKEEKEKDKMGKKRRKFLGANVSKPEHPAVEDSDYKPIFGVPLAMAVGRSRCHDGIQLPVIVRDCLDFIEEFGLTCEGIYRISGVKSKVQALKDGYNRGMPMYLHEHEPSIVASLLKQYLRELPEPVLTKALMPKFEEASTQKNVKQKVESFQQLIEQLPLPNKLLLSWMIVHMTHIIAKEKQNKMSLQNVSIVLSPTMQISHRVLHVLFTHAKIFFRDTVIKKNVPPLRPVTSRWSLELPESPTAIEEELRKQESLLNQLHEQLMRGKDPEKEEQVWEVQRVVTQLKRKLKSVKKAHDSVSEATSKDSEMAKKKKVPTATLR